MIDARFLSSTSRLSPHWRASLSGNSGVHCEGEVWVKVLPNLPPPPTQVRRDCEPSTLIVTSQVSRCSLVLLLELVSYMYIDRGKTENQFPPQFPLISPPPSSLLPGPFPPPFPLPPLLASSPRRLLEQHQVAEMAMIPSKEAKEMLYSLLAENFVTLQVIIPPSFLLLSESGGRAAY